MIKKLTERTGGASPEVSVEPVTPSSERKRTKREREPRHEKRYAGYPEVLERYPVDKITVQRCVERGEFPRPMRIGRRVLWDEATLDAFEEQKKRTADAIAEAKTQSKHAKQDRAQGK